jgi:hypothetical protein
VSGWVCLKCGAHDEGELDGDVCPKCGCGEGRLTVWLCCECWTEGTGQRPSICPACGFPDSWYVTTADPANPRPAQELFNEMLDGIFGPSRSQH